MLKDLKARRETKQEESNLDISSPDEDLETLRGLFKTDEGGTG